MTERRWRWLTADEWDRIAAASPDATWFHTRHWSEAMRAHDGRFEARALGLELSGGETALVPLALRRGALRKGLFARAISTRPGTYGGPLILERAIDGATWGEVFERLRNAGIGRLDCFGNVQSPVPAELVEDLTSEERETQAIDFAAAPGDLRARYEGRCRNALSKAERSNLSCALVDTREGVAEYFAIYEDSLRRWETPPEKPYGLALFEELFARPGAELWAARQPDGAMIAGGVFLFAKRHCAYWHGSMLHSAGKSRPTNLLLDRVIHDARERGVERFDFLPSGGHEGVKTFKQSFGARPIRYRTFRLLHPMLSRLGSQ